jgi:hypothetical protein
VELQEYGGHRLDEHLLILIRPVKVGLVVRNVDAERSHRAVENLAVYLDEPLALRWRPRRRQVGGPRIGFQQALNVDASVTPVCVALMTGHWTC